jgi:hypothetical protein
MGPGGRTLALRRRPFGVLTRHARPCRWGIANAERMMVRADQLQLCALLSRKGNSGEVWRGMLWGKQVAVKLVRIEDVEERLLDCLRREVAVLLHTTGECKQVRPERQRRGRGQAVAGGGRRSETPRGLTRRAAPQPATPTRRSASTRASA